MPSDSPSARIHIFWEKRIRSGDDTTPWWFPSQTGGGSIREDRLVLPIPPGVHWKDVMPVILPGGTDDRPMLEAPKRKCKPKFEPTPVGQLNGISFAAVTSPAREKPRQAVPLKKKHKNDPRLVAAARELRDRWMEKVNENPSLIEHGKYDVTRLPSPTREPIKMLAA